MPDNRPSMDGAEIERRRNALRTARSRLSDHSRAELNLENLRGQLTSLSGSHESTSDASKIFPIPLVALLAIAGVVLIVAGAYLGQESLALGLGGGLTLLVTAYLLFRNRTTSGVAANPLVDTLARSVHDAEAAADRTKDMLMEAAQPLEIDGVPTADALDNTEARLEAAAIALTAWKDANDRVDEANHALNARQRRTEEFAKQARSADEAENGSQQEWRQWLGRQGLPEGFTPDAIVEFTGRIETARAILEQVRRMRQRVSAIEVDIDEYLQLVQPLAVRYGVSIDESHSRIMSAADTLIEGFDAVQHFVIQRDEVFGRLKRQEQDVAAAEAEHASAAHALAETQTRWSDWLQARSLRPNFTPDALLEFQARAETAHASRTEARRMRQRVSAIEVDIDQFRDRVQPLAQAHGVALDSSDPRQLASAADTLIGMLGEAQRHFAERQQAARLQAQQRQRLQQMEQRLQSFEQQLAALMSAGGVDDAEEFRRRSGQHKLRLELEAQRDERVRRLVLLSGPDERLKAFREALSVSDRDRLGREAEILVERVEAVDVRREELRDERSRNNNDLDRLTSEEDSSALRIKRNGLVERLREHANEWSRLTIAGEILEKTQRKFENERQPSVIGHAREFFSGVTGQRYERLYAPVGEQTITVTAAGGADKQPSELSRGTREQLYLALRFGLIREFGEHAERLPVVVDEALVNFDPERARLAAGSFVELSKTNQVLVFTCHHTVADMFVDAGAQVVDISRRYA